MDKNIFELLDDHRSKWGKMLNNLGCPKRLIEDFTHDAYIKISELDDIDRIIHENGEINMYYVYFTLRSRVVDYYRENKLDYFSDIVDIQDDELDVDNEILLMNLYNDMMDKMDSFGHYGSKLCKIYLPTSRSLREIANESGISLTSIHHSIKQYKSFLKEEFIDEYKKYKKHKQKQ